MKAHFLLVFALLHLSRASSEEFSFRGSQNPDQSDPPSSISNTIAAENSTPLFQPGCITLYTQPACSGTSLKVCKNIFLLNAHQMRNKVNSYTIDENLASILHKHPQQTPKHTTHTPWRSDGCYSIDWTTPIETIQTQSDGTLDCVRAYMDGHLQQTVVYTFCQKSEAKHSEEHDSIGSGVLFGMLMVLIVLASVVTLLFVGKRILAMETDRVRAVRLDSKMESIAQIGNGALFR